MKKKITVFFCFLSVWSTLYVCTFIPAPGELWQKRCYTYTLPWYFVSSQKTLREMATLVLRDLQKNILNVQNVVKCLHFQAQDSSAIILKSRGLKERGRDRKLCFLIFYFCNCEQVIALSYEAYGEFHIKKSESEKTLIQTDPHHLQDGTRLAHCILLVT